MEINDLTPESIEKISPSDALGFAENCECPFAMAAWLVFAFDGDNQAALRKIIEWIPNSDDALVASLANIADVITRYREGSPQ